MVQVAPVTPEHDTEVIEDLTAGVQPTAAPTQVLVQPSGAVPGVQQEREQATQPKVAAVPSPSQPQPQQTFEPEVAAEPAAAPAQKPAAIQTEATRTEQVCAFYSVDICNLQ